MFANIAVSPIVKPVPSRLLALLGVLLLTALFGTARAQYLLPGALGAQQQGTVTVRYQGETFSYTPGLGWLGVSAGLSAPVLERNQVYLESDVLEALGVTLPRLTGVRSSGGGTVRLVFDIEFALEVNPENVADAGSLKRLRQSGRVGAYEPLALELPPLLVPQDLPERLEGLALDVRVAAEITRLELRGPAFSYEVFSLEGPTRVVVDITADFTAAVGVAIGAGTTNDRPTSEPGTGAAEAATEDATTDAAEDAVVDLSERLLQELRPPPPEAPRTLAPGVTLRHFVHPSVAGESRVDLVEIAPGGGDFKVVAAGEAQPLSELVGDGLVGINASYFNTADGQTIGLLKQSGHVRSLPSRNRAAIGFGFGDPLIGRLSAGLSLSLNGLPYRLGELRERVVLYTTPGAQVGSPRRGALVVQRGRVLENKVGPREVPAGGFVLSYAPELRELALLDTGDRVTLEAQFNPRAFSFTPEAVEAGPLLVADGRPAYRPELEAFDTEGPESNINRRTTRAAVGVREEGTVLLLTATELTAAELVPLFLELGAESALQMDSGGSSTLVASGEVINRPAFSQRDVATAIVFTPRRPQRADGQPRHPADNHPADNTVGLP